MTLGRTGPQAWPVYSSGIYTLDFCLWVVKYVVNAILTDDIEIPSERLKEGRQ